MRQSQKNKAGFLLTAFCAVVFCASAQKTFKYQAPLYKVDSGGFYKISLQPDFVAKSNEGLTDIRLMDQKGHFVPYITADNLPRTDNEKFIVFPEVTIKTQTDTGTTFIIESKETAPVNKLWLKLKSTAVKRTVNLSGSDDLQRWFAIEEDIPLQEAVLDNNGSYLQSISFPASNYHYLKLLVNDKNKAPVKFLQAGIYTEQSVANRYFPIPNTKFVKKDTNKVTYINIQLNDNYLVNQLDLNISGPKYYKRDVSVYQIDKQGKHLITNAELNSGKKGVLLITAKTNRLELQIENGDNLPLDIEGVTASQADQFITAYLESGQSYKILTGDKNAVAPVYDLKFFADSIHNYIPEVTHDQVTKNIVFETPGIKAPRHDYTIVVWIAIVIALVLLTLLTLKMTKEVNKKNNAE
ncbi:DUF3999 family protein [Mucilaginibacter sp. OK098]|uniref:DUF3999 family protein n=1 Tax=Mucilaginibacter sp. OK098 TaxID=1855297 RepID=UPI00091EF2D5|nr:DUF3999 family protein [Mucilaginibacter sp. OK098]SHN31793.1 Protein of unknown function [Mucilaginibacter sp. OK098]